MISIDTFTAQVINDTTVAFTWSYAGAEDPGATITDQYTALIGRVGSPLTNVTSELSYTQGNLTPGTVYDFILVLEFNGTQASQKIVQFKTSGMAPQPTPIQNPKPSPNNLGPDNNLPLGANSVTYTLPPGRSAYISFASQADAENALCVYDPDWNKIMERGNYSRSLSPAQLPHNGSNAGIVYSFTGWSKADSPNGSLPWKASSARAQGQPPENFAVSFDDGSLAKNGVPDYDYNDMQAFIQLEPS